MVLLLITICLFMTIYVYYLQRSLILVCLRKKHSKSYLKKLFQSSSKAAKTTGFYLCKDKDLEERWLLPALAFANANLLDIPLVVSVGIDRSCILFAQNFFVRLVQILGLKDILIIIVVFILTKNISE